MPSNVVLNSISIAINAALTQATGLTAQGLTLAQQLVAGQMKNGTGAGLVAQLFQGQFTLATNSNTTLDMYAFGGALDAGGNAYTMAQIKVLIIQNLGVNGAIVESDILTIGALGTTAGWTSLLTPNTAGLIIPSGGTIAFANPTANTGLVVGSSTTNHNLKFTSGASNTGTITYNVIAIG